VGGVRLNLDDLVVRQPRTRQEWQDYYALRWQILRAPWEQPPGSERDQLEGESVHLMLSCGDGEVVAVGRLHRAREQVAQIRYMAVATEFQRRGLGRRLLAQLEGEAIQTGYTQIILEAREHAVAFYRRHGYRVVRPSHELFGQIRHFLMTKRLVESDGCSAR
jgi:ribosomal protein S18 acetylase RimI-like enzyme